MSKAKIRDVRVILTEPDNIRLVIVKVETTEPGLYGVGCATFTQPPPTRQAAPPHPPPPIVRLAPPRGMVLTIRSCPHPRIARGPIAPAA